MAALADAQRNVRAAVIGGDASAIAAMLIGGGDPLKRLAIHARHYEASLATALAARFPALIWLTGLPFVDEAARAFAHRHPPMAPCIAEYGEDFPRFLAQRPGAERVPYLRWVGELEWRLGQVALAIARPPVAIDALREIDGETLAGMTLRLQAGLRHFAAPWPIDELMQLFLTDAAPERYAMAPADISLEVFGARGEFTMTRLGAPVFRFRQAIACGASIGAAAERALDADAAFEPGAALQSLFADGLVVEAVQPRRRSQP